MYKLLRTRNGQISLFMAFLIVFLFIRLFILTIVEGDSWSERAENISVRNIYTVAPRGEILDRNGNLLAGNMPSFAVQFSPGNLDGSQINQQAQELISILEADGDSYYDNFPIVSDGKGGFYYTYQKNIEDWLTSQGMPTNYTAEQAFNLIRQRQGIDPSLDVYDAQQQLIDRYNLTLPISVKKMEFTDQMDLEKFLDRYNLAFNLTAAQAFAALRGKDKFNIDPSLSDEQARKIMIVRDELAAQGFYKYVPAKIAQGVSDKTVAVLEERKSEMSAVEVVAESTRYYPNGDTASHVLGYLGQISESQKQEYVNEKGYGANDMIGQEGIEKKYEDKLKGKDGVKKVEINALGKLVRNISDTPPQKGEDVYLTLDLDLQKTAEDALRRSLTALQTGGTFESKWGNYHTSTKYPNANAGAVVAIDVKTGEILAMASYPDFDPNLFAKGISKADWSALQPVNPRDQLSPRPLLNIAANTAVQPGSTFKMVTAMAALQSGLNPDRIIRDKGFIQYGNRTYGCSAWNLNHTTHGNEDMYKAMAVSCNYYFYCLISNKDWITEKSMGLTGMDIDKVMNVAREFGLGMPTGFELPERTGNAPTAESKLESTEALLRNMLISNGDNYFTSEVASNKDTLYANVKTIVSWTKENPSRNEIIRRLPALGVKADKVANVADLCKYTYFNKATWNLGDEFNLSIGQGENAYTPLQIANYVATLGNGGVHNPVNVVRAVEGQGKIQKPAGTRTSISEEHLKIILKSMEDVAGAEGGGAEKVFRNFPIDVAAKTGTAQKSGKVPPISETAYIQDHLHSIDPALSWNQVEAEIARLRASDPQYYASDDDAVRDAVRNLSKLGRDRVTERIDQYKSDYGNFAWFVSMAPKEDPQIAVAVLGFQGGFGVNMAPVAREVIAEYLGLNQDYQDYQINTVVSH